MIKKKTKPKTTKRKKRSKPIKLNPLFWLRNSKDIQEKREELLKERMAQGRSRHAEEFSPTKYYVYPATPAPG